MDRRKFMGGVMVATGSAIAGKAGAETYDLVLRDVRALIGGEFVSRDIAINGENIAAIGAPCEFFGKSELECHDLYASPGWVDLHCHYVGWRHRKSAGSPIDILGTASGVTALLDVGTTGAYNYNRLEKAVADAKDNVPCYALLNIKRGGIKLSSFYTTRVGDDDIPAMEQVIDDHRGRILGLKLRADNMVSDPRDRLYYVRKIREAGDLYNLPIMIHIGSPPPHIDDVLEYMKEGDIVTHFLRSPKHSIVEPGGKVRDSVWDAVKRGVKFDLGHGMGSYSFESAERALDQGFTDFTVSSDLYIVSRPLYAKTFANVLTNLLAVGMPLENVMERASTKPAPFLGLQRVIKPGAEATLTLFKLAEGRFTCTDTTRQKRKLDHRVIPEWTILKGEKIRAGREDRRKFLRGKSSSPNSSSPLL